MTRSKAASKRKVFPSPVPTQLKHRIPRREWEATCVIMRKMLESGKVDSAIDTLRGFAASVIPPSSIFKNAGIMILEPLVSQQAFHAISRSGINTIGEFLCSDVEDILHGCGNERIGDELIRVQKYIRENLCG